jgi:hypothetical protein
MDLTLQRLNDSQLIGLDPSGMLAACLCTSQVSFAFRLIDWLINYLLHLHRESNGRMIRKGCWEGVIYEQSQSRSSVFGSRDELEISRNRNRISTNHHVWFCIPRKGLPRVKLTQPAGHLDTRIPCWEADLVIPSYVLETVRFVYKITWSCSRLQNKTANSALAINLNCHFSRGTASFTTLWNQGWHTLALIFNYIFP